VALTSAPRGAAPASALVSFPPGWEADLAQLGGMPSARHVQAVTGVAGAQVQRLLRRAARAGGTLQAELESQRAQGEAQLARVALGLPALPCDCTQCECAVYLY
jgi:hypothetical protein